MREMTQENSKQKDISSKQEALHQAFLQFNQVSSTLSEAYAGLESRVEVLSKELAEARSQKIHELEAKEKVTNRLQNLLSALPGAIIVLDGEGIIQQSNPAAEKMFELTLVGQSWRKIVKQAFQPQWDDGHDVTLKNGRCVNISTQPLGAEPGQILLITDVTETRQLQEQIAGLKRVTAMGEMAAAMAHQIRTPLASAMLYASNLDNKQINEENRQRFSKKILSSLRHLETLVEDMLLFSRGGHFNTTPIDIEELIEDFIQQLQLKDIPIKIENELHFGCIVNICRNAFTSALQNLINNSLEATTDDLQILIKLRQVNNVVKISILDNGCGIPENIKSRLFEPFVTSRNQGTGLGLAVVNSVINAHKGEIIFDDKKTDGACFEITLPVCEYENCTEVKSVRSVK